MSSIDDSFSASDSASGYSASQRRLSPALSDSVYAQALADTLSSIAVSGEDSAGNGRVLAVAYSGGLDSSVLLDVAAAYARQHHLKLFAFHIHHGLSIHADQWLAHCRQRCQLAGIAFDSEQVALQARDKSGVEEAARLARYAALGRLSLRHEVDILLSAHHQDDQAETVLLQLLRGSGVAGLSGMDAFNTAPGLLGSEALTIARPLLSFSRAQLESYAQHHALPHIEDESNADTRYARNNLRHRVMPALAASFPGFQERFARTAQHAASAQKLLIELGQQDFSACCEHDYLLMAPMRELSEERFYNLLRYWFGLRGMRMPSSAWLLELRAQLLQAKDEAQLCVSHPDGEIHRYRGRVFLTPRRTPPDEAQADLHFVWSGEDCLRFPAFGGTLHFDRCAAEVDAQAGAGVDAQWLRGKDLSVRVRSGGERVRLAFNRPAKSLKYHYQSLDIPAWERPFLPMVFVGEELLYAAGIGMDCSAPAASAERISLRWQSE
ncbi:tRNA lysidine(34) synthetase TilS [Herbaspirillum lusitanum]|uniref:tRNA(Ile)-lysidine synthase n=1 Tax=Herbaspirillum lusitanum TaxID=213312 RepID=A0ABW9AD53_9BURK